jgi:hypothetical protein
MHLRRQKYSQHEHVSNVLTEVDHGFDSDGKVINIYLVAKIGMDNNGKMAKSEDRYSCGS